MLNIKFKLNFFRNVYLRGWNLSWCWMNNEDESVHCDQDNGERREEDAAGLGGPDQLAEVLHVLAQGPILEECNISRLRAKKLLQFCILHTVQYWFWCNRSSEYWSDAVGNHLLSHLCQEINKCERHGEGAQQDVGDGQVSDEYVPCGQHHLVGQEGQDDGEVADHTKDDDQTVKNNQAVVNTRFQPAKI